MISVGARRWWAVAAIGIAMMAVGLDGTVLATALPTLARALDASTGQLQWMLDAYVLALAVGALPAGLLGDRLGRKKMIIGGLVAFGAGSAWCAWSSTAGELIAARTLLGLGAAVLLPLSLSVLTVLFEPHERQRAIAVMSIFIMIGIPLGPIVAGALLQQFWWGSVFVLNLPVVAIALVGSVVLIPESRGERGAALDWPGILGSGAGLFGITYGLIESQQAGWAAAPVLVSLIGGAALLAGFAWWQRRAAEPLLDLSLFSARDFTTGTVVAGLVNLVMFGMLFALPQFLQAVQGTDALATGLRTLPLVVALMVGLQLANRFVPRLGAMPVMTAGLAATAGGAAIGTLTTASTDYGFVAAWTAIFGLGVGLTLVTAMVTATNPLSRERAGIGSSMLMVARQAGSALGIALLGTVLAAGYRSALDVSGLPAAAADAARGSAAAGVAAAHRLQSPELAAGVRAAFTHGMDVMLWTTAGIALAALLGLAMSARSGRAAAPAGGAELEHAGS